jgi:hypothetical protein
MVVDDLREEALLVLFAPHAGEEADDADVHVEGERACRIALGKLLHAAGGRPEIRALSAEALGNVERRETALLEDRHQLVREGVIPIVLRADLVELPRDPAGRVYRRLRLVHRDFR